MRISSFFSVWLFSFCLFVSLQAVESVPSVYFTSEVDLSEKFIEQIKKESCSIRMASHRLSDVKVIHALIAAHRRGVSVEVMVDPITVTSRSPLRLLDNEGVKVWIWQDIAKLGKEKNRTIKHMRHIFSVFGEEVVWTGTYGFSLKRFYSHRESALLLQDKGLAKSFLAEFNEMRDVHAVPFSSRALKRK